MTLLDVRFSDWIQKGFALFTGKAAVLISCGLVAVAISAVTLGLLTGPMLAGMAVIILNLLDTRLAPPTVNDLFKGFDFTVATIPVTLGFYAVFAAWWILQFIPLLGQVAAVVVASVGIAIGVLSVFHLVARKVDPRASAPILCALFMANWGPLLGFFILLALIGISGILLIIVGLVATIPLYLVILGVAYLDILRQTAEL